MRDFWTWNGFGRSFREWKVFEEDLEGRDLIQTKTWWWVETSFDRSFQEFQFYQIHLSMLLLRISIQRGLSPIPFRSKFRFLFSIKTSESRLPNNRWTLDPTSIISLKTVRKDEWEIEERGLAARIQSNKFDYCSQSFRISTKLELFSYPEFQRSLWDPKSRVRSKGEQKVAEAKIPLNEREDLAFCFDGVKKVWGKGGKIEKGGGLKWWLN